jgi:hypothetical protein
VQSAASRITATKETATYRRKMVELVVLFATSAWLNSILAKKEHAMKHLSDKIFFH